MTDSDVKTETWKPIPGARHYQACDVGGLIRSDRSGAWKPLTPAKTGTSRYWQVKYTDDTGRQRKRPVNVLVLEAHRGLAPPGMVCCHDDDNPDNNDLSNLRWDYPAANIADRMRNSPAAAKPPKLCIICEQPFDTSGRRCHGCRMKIAARGAALLAGGASPEEAGEELSYPPLPLLKLAREHGGLRLTLTQSDRRPFAQRLRRVMFGREASRRNSDGA